MQGKELLGPFQGVRRDFLEEETLALSLDKELGSRCCRQKAHVCWRLVRPDQEKPEGHTRPSGG